MALLQWRMALLRQDMALHRWRMGAARLDMREATPAACILAQRILRKIMPLQVGAPWRHMARRRMALSVAARTPRSI